MSDEKSELQKAADRIRELLTTDKYLNIFMAMRTIRQAYGLLQSYLHKCLQEDNVQEILAEDFFIGSVAYASLRPFDSETFYKCLKDYAIPTIHRIISGHDTNIDTSTNDNQFYSACPWGIQRDIPGLPIDKPVVLVGSSRVLRFLLYLLLWESYSQYRTVVHFHNYLCFSSDTKIVPSSRYIPVNLNCWQGIGDSSGKLLECLQNCVFSLINDKIDLFIIDNYDLCLSSSRTYKSRPAAANAGDANYVVSSLCSRFVSPVIACLPVESDNPDLSTPDYEKLKFSSYLCSVQLQNVDNLSTRIIINNQFELTVPEANLCNTDFSFLFQ